MGLDDIVDKAKPFSSNGADLPIYYSTRSELQIIELRNGPIKCISQMLACIDLFVKIQQ